MEPFPADWRIIGEPAPAASPAATTGRGEGGRVRGSSIEQGHRMVAMVAAAAVAAGVLALAGTLWLTSPRGDVEIAARAPAAGNAAASLSGLLVRGSPAAAYTSPAVVDAPAELVVDVEGAVRRPGIQRLAAGSRVGDAIAAAGGYGERADVAAAALNINLAEALKDGAKVRVPALGETAAGGTAPATPAGSPPAGTGGLIDLNHADEGQLESLPGVGPVTAAKIIDARSTALFASVDDLGTRGVVGPSTLEKLRPLITVTP